MKAIKTLQVCARLLAELIARSDPELGVSDENIQRLTNFLVMLQNRDQVAAAWPLLQVLFPDRLLCYRAAPYPVEPVLAIIHNTGQLRDRVQQALSAFHETPSDFVSEGATRIAP